MQTSDEIHCLRELSCNFARLLQLKSLMSVSILIRFLFLTHLLFALTNICHPESFFFLFLTFQLFCARCCQCGRMFHLIFMSSSSFVFPDETSFCISLS